MTDTNQLPPLPTPKFTETIRGVPCITVTEHEHLMRVYALQARVQVQGEPIGEVGTMPGTSGFTMACFRADEVPVGTKIYTTQQPAQATQAEVTNEREAFESCALMEGSLFKRRADDPDKYWDGNVQDDWELWKARAILAMRPERVPMTERELELIDGMIAVHLDHAQRCDAISNRAMAEKQKGWDMERVELLRRLSFAAQTTGGTAGPDAELQSAIGQAEQALSLGGIWQAMSATPEPVVDVRCEGCGYMTHHREHMGCVRAAKQHTHPAPSVPDDVVRDAERYRWLRDNGVLGFSGAPSWRVSVSFDAMDAYAQTLDSNIDAATLAAKDSK